MERPPGRLQPISVAGLLQGRRAIVTGGARRIGRGVALALAAQGADVVVTSREGMSAAEGTVTELQRRGVRSHAVGCEVGDPASVQRAVADAAEYLGGIDLLVNNAGAFETAALESMTPQQWDSMFATNTRGPFLVAQAAYPWLSAGGEGRIVNIGSLGGMHPWATHAHYCTSKAALHMLSQTMAKAWAPAISVNCVAPGMIVMGDSDPAYDSFAAKTPMARNGRVEDVAEAVLFFAAASRFITGQVLAVDGGLGLS